MTDLDGIALFGLFGVGNIGNEASLAAGIAAVEHHSKTAELVVVAALPEVVGAEHDVNAVPISMAGPFDRIGNARRPVRIALRPLAEVARWLAALRFARSVDAIIVPGTGILDDFGVAPHQMPYELFRWSTVARLTRRPWIMVGVGAGPIDHPVSRWLMRRTVRNTTSITYRDEVSRSFMEGLGEHSPATALQPDVAFALPRPDDCRAARRAGAHVGLGLMSYYGWRNDPSTGRQTFDRYISDMTEIAAGLLDHGHTLRILVGEGSDDVAVERLTIALDHHRPGWRSSDGLTVEPIRNFGQLLEQVAATDAVVATRYHNVVAGLMMSRPTIAIGYAEKFRHVMSDFGLEAYCHDIDHLDVDRVIADLGSALGRAAEIEAGLVGLNLRNRRAVEARFNAILDDVFAPT